MGMSGTSLKASILKGKAFVMYNKIVILALGLNVV